MTEVMAAMPRRTEVLTKKMDDAMANVERQRIRLDVAMRERDEAMANLHKAGYTLQEIGKLIGFSHVGVAKAIKRTQTEPGTIQRRRRIGESIGK